MKKEILIIVYEAISELNKEHGLNLKMHEDTKLAGEIDSILLVTLIAKIESKYPRRINIASDKAFSQKNSPFLTVSTLTDFIETL